MTIRIAKGRDGVDRSDVPIWFDLENYQFRDKDAKEQGSQRGPKRKSDNSRADASPRAGRRGPSGGNEDLDPLAT